MKTFLAFAAIIILTTSSFGQSRFQFRLSGHPTVKGEVEAETETDLLVRDQSGSLISIPKDKIRTTRPYQTYLDAPGYDQNRDDFYFGLEWGYNQTIGQKDQNFYGWTFFGRAGYDWDHRFAIDIKTGINNMNFTGLPIANNSSKELYIPIVLSVKKYLTKNRHLLYLSLGHGYSWGLGPVFKKELKESGAGTVIIPGIGIRRIGKYGQDYELQLGLHLQQMYSRNKNPSDLRSELEINYRRWSLSYGVMF